MTAVRSGELKVVPVASAAGALKNDGDSRAVA
jgi:hypothetical protein